MRLPLFNSKSLFRSAVACLCLAMFAGSLSGCASTGGKTYREGEVRTAQRVKYGTVISVQEVRVEDDPSMLGIGAGGAAGGVIGNLFGHGAGRTMATLGGVAVGALAGAATESAIKSYTADEITIELEDGETIVVVQGQDDYFNAGDRVRVLYTSANTARVQH